MIYVLESKVNGDEYKSFTVVKATKCQKLTETKFIFDNVEIEFDEETTIRLTKELDESNQGNQ
jgi:hypothetical protein